MSRLIHGLPPDIRHSNINDLSFLLGWVFSGEFDSVEGYFLIEEPVYSSLENGSYALLSQDDFAIIWMSLTSFWWVLLWEALVTVQVVHDCVEYIYWSPVFGWWVVQDTFACRSTVTLIVPFVVAEDYGCTNWILNAAV
nr:MULTISPECIES: hypothetical protein [Providencia]